jgi:hypothetical protein
MGCRKMATRPATASESRCLHCYPTEAQRYDICTFGRQKARKNGCILRRGCKDPASLTVWLSGCNATSYKLSKRTRFLV